MTTFSFVFTAPTNSGITLLAGATSIVLQLNNGVGQRGKSAYQSALDTGFVGTEAEWIASLHGASASQLQLVAAIALGGHRGVIETIGGCIYADNLTLAHAGKLVGVTIGAVASGAGVSVAVTEELIGFTGLTVGDPLYLSINGVLTQTAPTTGFHQQVGIATTATRVLIGIKQPIILG